MSEFGKLQNIPINWLEINITNDIPFPLRIRTTLHEYSIRDNTEFTTSTNDLGTTSSQPDNDTNCLFTTMLVVGMVVTMTVSIIGSIGNLLTMSTLIHQFRMPSRKRYITKITSDTILILNLCIADFCYSSVSLTFMFIIYKKLYFNPEDDEVLSNNVCKWAAFIRYTNAITEWTTLGLMALERCVTIYRFQRKMLPSGLFTPARTLSYCIVLWLIGMAAQTPTLTENFGEFGYNNYTLKCDFMPTGNNTYFVSPRVFFFALESAVPCFCILIGYIIILTQVYSSKHFFTGNNSLTSATQMSMALRRSRTTRLIVLLLTMYLVCVIPICIYNVVIREDNLGELSNQIIGIALYCLYWLQYGANNFIYVVSNEKYRNAYSQFFRLILCRDVPSPSKAKYLRMVSHQTALTIKRETPKMRLRTPSEMTLECIYSNGSFKTSTLSTSETKISFKSTNFNLESLLELPILIFPKAQLNNMCSSIKKTGARCRSTFNRGRHRSFDFKRNRRRLSLDETEKMSSYTRKRSLSV